MRIAFCQQEIAFEDKNENLKRICSFVEKAKKENAEVIFFPEMSFTGFSMNIKNTVEKSDDNINIIKNSYKKRIYKFYKYYSKKSP